MQEQDAARKRRSRAHLRGDHSLCNPTRCSEADKWRIANRPRIHALHEAGDHSECPDSCEAIATTEDGVTLAEWVAIAVREGGFTDADPRTEMLRLADEHASDPAHRDLVIELVAYAMESPDDPPCFLDEVRLSKCKRYTALTTHLWSTCATQTDTKE